MPRVVPNSVILPRCLEGLNVFCFVFFSYLSPAAYGSGKSGRNKAVTQFSRKNGSALEAPSMNKMSVMCGLNYPDGPGIVKGVTGGTKPALGSTKIEGDSPSIAR